MNRLAFKKIIFALVLFPVLAVADQVGAPVTIDPTVQDYSGFTRQLLKKFFIGEVLDKRKNVGSDTIGFTRTGRFVTSALLCKPLPSAVLGNSLAGMLRQLDALVEEKISANFQISIEVLEFDVVETNKVFSQQVKAMVKFRVKVWNAATGSLVNQFVIRSEDARSVADATPFAVTVARNAIISGLQDLLESLGGL